MFIFDCGAKVAEFCTLFLLCLFQRSCGSFATCIWLRVCVFLRLLCILLCVVTMINVSDKYCRMALCA